MMMYTHWNAKILKMTGGTGDFLKFKAQNTVKTLVMVLKNPYKSLLLQVNIA